MDIAVINTAGPPIVVMAVAKNALVPPRGAQNWCKRLSLMNFSEKDTFMTLTFAEKIYIKKDLGTTTYIFVVVG